MKWKFTRLWEIDKQLVAADSIPEAIKIYNNYMGVTTNIKTIKAVPSEGGDYEVLTEAQEVADGRVLC